MWLRVHHNLKTSQFKLALARQFCLFLLIKMKYVFFSVHGQNNSQDFEVAVEKEVKLASVVNENNIDDVSEPRHLLFDESLISENVEFKNPVIPSCVSGAHLCHSPVFDGVNNVSDQAKVEAQACDLSAQVYFNEEPVSLTIDEVEAIGAIYFPFLADSSDILVGIEQDIQRRLLDLSDPLKRYFRLSVVPLKLCRFILGCAIQV